MNGEPGWYTDPFFFDHERYWDGSSWSDHARPLKTQRPGPGAPTSSNSGAPPTASTPATTSTSAATGTGATAAGAAAAAARPPRPAGAPDPVTAAYPRTNPTPPPPVPDDPTITGVVPAQPGDPTITGVVPARPEDPMITGVVPAQADEPITGVVPAHPGEPAPTGTTPAKPSGPPAVTDLLQGQERQRFGPAHATARGEGRSVAEPEDLVTPGEPAGGPPHHHERRGRGHHQQGSHGAATRGPARRGSRRGPGRRCRRRVSRLRRQRQRQSGSERPSRNCGAPHAAQEVRRRGLHRERGVGRLVVGGGVVGLTGTGAFDLASNSGTIALTTAGGGTQGTEQLVFVGKTVYISFPGISLFEPGKSWISADPSELASASSGIGSGASGFEQLLGNPAASVHQLQSSGLTVTPLGPSTYLGTPVQGYRVVLTRSAIAGDNAGVHGSETLYVTSKHLVRAIVVPITVTASGGTFSETLTMAFSNYGALVTVAPPPATQVVSFTQYEAIQNEAT